MSIRPFCCLIILLMFAPFLELSAQGISRLLQEREELIVELQEVESNNSSLFGKKSKKDFKNATQILKEIVEKDSEIISALRRELRQKEMQQAEPVQEFELQIVTLENKLASLNNVANQKTQQTVELEKQVAIVKDRMFKYQSTILFSFVIILILVVYISKLRKKAKTYRASQKSINPENVTLYKSSNPGA